MHWENKIITSKKRALSVNGGIIFKDVVQKWGMKI
jgi:hypothetical protein